MEHVGHDFELLQHHGDGLGLVDAGVLLVVARILAERRFQVLGNTDVVHDQTGWLVAEYAVHSRDRLHEPVPPHGFVDVHRVHARRVEAGQPHVPDDHQLEQIVGVLRPLGEQFPARLAADVLLPFLRVRGRACHDDLDFAALVVVTVPLRAQLDDFVVERNANSTAHADDHGLAVHADDAVLEVLHEVVGDHGEAFLGPDDGFNVRPFALELLLLVLGLVFGQLGDLVVEVRLLVLIQFDTGDGGSRNRSEPSRRPRRPG